MFAELKINRIELLDSLGIIQALNTQLKYCFYFYLLVNFKLFSEKKKTVVHWWWNWPCFEHHDFIATDLNLIHQKLIETYIIKSFYLNTVQSIKQNHSFEVLKMLGQPVPGSCEIVFSPYKFINIGSIDVWKRWKEACFVVWITVCDW